MLYSFQASGLLSAVMDITFHFYHSCTVGLHVTEINEDNITRGSHDYLISRSCLITMHWRRVMQSLLYFILSLLVLIFLSRYLIAERRK